MLKLSGFFANQGSPIPQSLQLLLASQGIRVVFKTFNADDEHSRIHFHLFHAGENTLFGQFLLESLGSFF